MSNAQHLVLGTHNVKKASELRLMLEPLGFSVQTLADFPNAMDVVEDGTTFAQNAALKATQQAIHLDAWVVGEDSGLAVDALNGEPGIYSARYASLDSDTNAGDEANNLHLLKQLENVPLEKRTAHYVCHMALSDPEGNIVVSCEAYCQGRIRLEPVGSGGFGYDPLFEIVELHKTFGQLGPSVKAMISHRARALRMFVRLLAKTDRQPS
ncbi:MAG: RdgB/HAM1 family non-canonical purine NTP pyrophosphatase [Planctomycetales bacterium]|nr:RdgB/HAM1 family non-canonical purine NTP pyrophosphatase [Planctomycetales bacterium]